MGLKEVKVTVGMVSSYFFPITAEPANSHPTYGAKVDMGAAVRGVLGITTNSIDIPGDDEILLHDEAYSSHQMEVETTLDDLQRNSTLYGHRYENGVETSGGEDKPPYGAYAYIESLLLKDKSRVYRATFFYKMTALQSAERSEANTKGVQLTYANHAVTFYGQVDNAGSWRARKDFATLADAEAYIDQCAGATGAYLVNITSVGSGTFNKPAAAMVQAGQNYQITFSVQPTKVYDQTGSGVTDITNSVTSKVLTLSSLAANHSITAIFA